ncbi:MAG TPA: hypothetical protein VET23_04770, partial [Chitinophagaceae bacterium]|nr:hypothetical protein [Chitinophagaceae bacterium]
LQHDKKSDHCSKCRMKKDQSNKGCCKNENKVIKITTDQKADINLYQAFQVSFVTLASPVIELTVPFDSSLTDKIAVSHAPPLNGDTGIYLLNCVFRI